MRSLHPAAADHSVSIRGSRCTALIILSLRSRAVVFHYCSSWRYEKLHECGRYGTAAVVAVSRENNGPWRQSHRSVRWPAPLRASALKEQISLKEYTGDRVFLKMSYHPCVSGCGRSLAPQDGHDHCLTCLGIQHAEEAFVDGSCSSCGDMTISELRNRLRCVKHGGVPLPLPRSGVRPGTKRGGTASGGVRGDLRITVRASPSGGSHPSGTPQPAGVPLVRTGTSAEWGTPPVSFGASPDDQMSVAASEGEPSLSGDDDSAALPPSGVVALSEPDPEMTAMLSRAAENVGLVWNPPPRPDPSRLDEWFLGGGVALVFSAPLRCHSFRKCMRSLQGHGRHLLLPEINLVAPPPSPPSMVEPLWGTRASPLWSGLWPCSCVQQSLPLCGVNRVSPHGPVSTRQASLAVLIEPVGRRLLPYTPWRYCRSIRPKHWETCTRVGTTWRFYMSCVLRRTSRSERRRWPHSLWVVRCPRLWSRSAISGCVSLTWRSRRRYSSWMLPCHRPAFSATLSRAVPSSFRQHRSRLRAIKLKKKKVIMRRRKPAAASTPAAAPQPARRRGRPPVAAPAPTPRQQPSTVRRRGAGHRQDAQPVQAPARPGGKRKCKRPWDGRPRDGGNCSSGDGDRTTPSPGGGPGGESFVFVPPLAQQPTVPKTSIKEQFPQSLGLKRRRVVYRASRDHFLPPLSPGRGGLPKSTPPAHLWNRVKAVALKPPLQVVTRKPGSCISSHTRRNQVSVTLHTQTPPPAITGQAFTGPGPGPCVPHRCPTTGTSAPLVPLARSLGAWLALPSPSRWLLRTIRLGYAIQFARRPPKFRGIRFTSVKPADAPVLRAEFAVLLAKDAIEPVPPADMRSGLFSPYFIVPKKGGGLRPILDLRVLNRALHKLPFKMLTQKRIFGCVRPLDWFAAIDLKDAYFHVSILPRHRPFLRFAFEGQTYQYKVLPFGLSLSPHVFTKVVEAALVPLREQGVRILNYLDDWLILAQSRKQLSAHRDLVLKHLSLLGLRVNWEKSKLVPTQRISFLGMEFDSVNQTARLTQERAQSVLNCFKTLSGRTAVPLKLFQRLLGHMAAAAVTVPLGLLHMRPLQHWLYGRIPRWAWKHGTYRVQITPACRKTFRPWSDPSFLRAGVPLEQVSRHAVVFTDASTTGWGATYNGHAVSGVWTGPQLHWHINCLELLVVRLALSRLRGRLQRKDVLVRTDNTATVAYINRQGGLRSRRMSQLARHLLLWSQKHLRSLRAIHIPGVFNRAADELSRAALPGEWRLHPQAVQLIWGRFGAAQVDLFASPETTHCQEFYSLTEATLGTDALAHSWPRGLRKYAFPPVSLLAQTLCKIREDEEQVLLVAPYWPNRTWFPELMLLATAPPWPIPLRKDLLSQRRGTLWHPRPDLWKLHVWSLDGTRRF